MTSQELADRVEQIIRDAQHRILGVGADQYDEGTTQKFEGMPLGELAKALIEEADDLIVYAAMLRIRGDRLLDLVTQDGR